MERIINFRTLASGMKNADGRTIKDNKIFRSGVLAYASDRDIAQLKEYGVSNILDFRSLHETGSIPPLPESDFTTHHYNILGKAGMPDREKYPFMTREQLKQMMVQMYAVSFANSVGYKDVVKTVLGFNGDPFLFHCSAGKDRTGVFGIILMLAMDFSMEDIRSEYLNIDQAAMDILTAQMFDGHEKQLGFKLDISKFQVMMTVLPDYIDAFFESIMDKYGSVDEYLLKAVGIDSSVKQLLKSNYLV